MEYYKTLLLTCVIHSSVISGISMEKWQEGLSFTRKSTCPRVERQQGVKSRKLETGGRVQERRNAATRKIFRFFPSYATAMRGKARICEQSVEAGLPVTK